MMVHLRSLPNHLCVYIQMDADADGDGHACTLPGSQNGAAQRVPGIKGVLAMVVIREYLVKQKHFNLKLQGSKAHRWRTGLHLRDLQTPQFRGFGGLRAKMEDFNMSALKAAKFWKS